MNTIWNRFIGFMFKKDKIDYGLCFKTNFGIHTFFMRQNIDLCIADKNNCIIYVESGLKKNKFRWKKKGKFYYELPLGTVQYLKIHDKL